MGVRERYTEHAESRAFVSGIARKILFFRQNGDLLTREDSTTAHGKLISSSIECIRESESLVMQSVHTLVDMRRLSFETKQRIIRSVRLLNPNASDSEILQRAFGEYDGSAQEATQPCSTA